MPQRSYAEQIAIHDVKNRGTELALTRNPEVIWEEPRRRPSRREWTHLLRVHDTSCAMPTADESNHSAAGTLHPHRSATFFRYVVLCDPIHPPTKIAPPFRGSHIHCHRGATPKFLGGPNLRPTTDVIQVTSYV